jgi:hypothetical protein
MAQAIAALEDLLWRCRVGDSDPIDRPGDHTPLTTVLAHRYA